MKRAIVFTTSMILIMVLLCAFGPAYADPLCPPTPMPTSTPMPMPTPTPTPLAFLDLTDTPGEYAGGHGLVVAINTDENGLVFTNRIGGDITIGRHLVVEGNVTSSNITARGIVYADSLTVARNAKIMTLMASEAEIDTLAVATTARVGSDLYVYGDVHVGVVSILNVIGSYSELPDETLRVNSTKDLPGSNITITGNSLVYGSESTMGNSYTRGAIQQGLSEKDTHGTRLRLASDQNGYAIFSDGYVTGDVTIFENGDYGGQVGPAHVASARWLVLDRNSGAIGDGRGLLMEGQGYHMIGSLGQGLEVRFARPAVPGNGKGRFYLRHSGSHTYNIVLEIMWVND